MVKWDTITDDFPGSALGAEWPGGYYGTTPTVSGNKLTFPSGSTYSGAGSAQHDLTSSSVLMKLDLATTTGLGYTGFYLAGPGNVGIALIEFEAGKMTGYIYGANWGGSDSQTQITWATSSSPVWVRFRHASTTLYLEYSTDGLSWTGLHNATPPSGMTTALATCNIEPNVGPTMTTSASFSKLNLAPTAVSVTPSRVNSSTAFFAPTPSSTSVVALSGRVAAATAIYLPSPGVASSVAPSRVDATSAVYLPNFSLGTLQVPNRISAVAAVFTPAALTSSGAAAPSRVGGLTVIYLPNIITTRLSTETPQFENPAPENDGWLWKYSDTLGLSVLTPGQAQLWKDAVADLHCLGSNTGDQSASIQAALDAGFNVYVGPGTFRTEAAITVPNWVDFRMHPAAELAYVGTGAAVVFDGHISMDIHLGWIRKTAAWHTGADTTSIGVDFQNCRECAIRASHVEGFNTGVRFLGDAAGCVSNTFSPGILTNNKRNLVSTYINAGWSNQNVVVGGRFLHGIDNGAGPVAGTVHIRLEDANGWAFYGSTLENDTYTERSVLFTGIGSYWNTIRDARWENAAPVEFADHASENLIDGGFGNLGWSTVDVGYLWVIDNGDGGNRVQAIGPMVPDTALPTASVHWRGQFLVKAQAATEDKVCVCVKDSGGAYKWINVKDGSTVT